MIYPLEKFKIEIISQLTDVLSATNLEIKLEECPEEMGDFAFPCFLLAPILKKSPVEIAQDLSKKTKKRKWISKVEARGGYVNFFIDDDLLIKETLNNILKLKENYGHLEKKDKKVIIEHTSANPNGPLHVGRARNPIIGDTLVRIFIASGYQVESQFYLDDMGKQVAILTWGLNNKDKFSKELKKYPTIGSANFSFKQNTSDHQNVIYYQISSNLMKENDSILNEINEIVKKLEGGESSTIKIVHNAYASVLDGMRESLKAINISFDRFVPESQFIEDKSVDVVIEKLKQSKYCNEEDGAYYLNLESFGIKGRNTKFFFLRRDGTSLYTTRDIAYHLWKSKRADILINILGEDHKLESKQVEISLKLLNVKTLPNGVFYSFVSLPEGKMSTRRARVVYLDELIDECIDRAYSEVKKRRGSELTEEQMKKIAEMVGIGSLRYNIIKVQPEKEIVFKWEEALNFEGNAAPFIQYAHARACSILSKTEIKNIEFDSDLLKYKSELKLIKQLAKFPYFIEEACVGFKPHIITNFLFETASKFNQFYRDCPVLVENNSRLRSSRLFLVNATRIVLQNALELIGISAPEEM